MPKVLLRLKDPNGVVRNLTNPEWWNKYKDKVLNTIALELPSFISNYVATGDFFKSRSGNAIRSFRAKANLGRDSVVCWSVADYLKYLNDGVRRQQMTWLVSASRPIPLQTPGGMIFRWATAKSMMDGKWVHPGLKETKFLDKAIEAYLDHFNQQHTEFILQLMK